MQRLVPGRTETAANGGRALTMESPSYVDVEDCKHEDDRAEDWRDNVLKSWEPVGYLWGGIRGKKSGICFDAVVWVGVGRGG